MTNTPWTAADYTPAITMEGARKLADSGVAPLIAAARGYYSVLDRSGAKALAEASALATGYRALTTKLTRMVSDDEDILVIPWFSAAQVAEKSIAAKSRTTQMRPSRPMMNPKTGKAPKYEFLAGEGTVLDFHPSTPDEWITSSLQVLMTEGVLKGDSALTGQLRANGITDAELAMPADPATARVTLLQLMLRVPKDKRVAIISFAGVANWRDHNDWRAIKLSNRKVIVAFDGDTTTNYNVWKQAKDVFDFIENSKKGQPFLLNLATVDVEAQKLSAGIDPTEKLGLDDYLTKVGDWGSALNLMQPDLPAAPARKDAERISVGSWRVEPTTGASVQEYAQDVNPMDGSKGAARWITRYSIGGRLMATESRRRPSQQEIESGRVDHDLDSELSDATCTIEISFAKPTVKDENNIASFQVTGPALILAYPPAEWPRHGASIPTDVLMHPEWPPRKGAEWLQAVKANRQEDVTISNGWDAMSWVPVEGSDPAFIVGNQVIGRTEEDQKRTVVGVTEKVLGGASSFGVIDTYHEIPIDEWKAQVRADIHSVLATYIESKFWADGKVAAAVVASMLRPTIPARINMIDFIFGPPRAGKTFTAAFIMAGWQSIPGTWHVHHLPGAADDTAASIEYALARTPIWPADDLAPSVDRRQADAQEASISRMIRSTFNHTTRRRMDADMKQRRVALPTALFIVTSENEPQVDSIRERIVALRTPADAFSKDPAVSDRISYLANVDGAPARLTAAMIRYWMLDSDRLGDSWLEKTTALKRELESVCATGTELLKAKYQIETGEATRHASMASDLAISFTILRWLASYVGIEEDDPIMEKLRFIPGSYAYRLFDLAADTIKRQRQTTPGRSLISALSKLMASGRAHVENCMQIGTPPVSPSADDEGGVIAAHENRALGWTFDTVRQTWVPHGPSIGFYGVRKGTGSRVVLFDVTNAFSEAKRAHPDKILPGQNATVSWASVWDEGLTDGARVRKDSNTLPVRLGKTGDEASAKLPRIYGVPVSFDAIIDPTFDPTGTGRFGDPSEGEL